MKALEILRTTKELLERAGIEDAAREAEIIIAHCLSIDRSTLYIDNPQIPKDLTTKIDSLLKRRTKREPLQYILGYVEFYDLKIKVGRGVLIPRPETELLAEEAIKIIKSNLLSPPHPPLTKGGQKGGGVSKGGKGGFRFLDLCTGSGCLALTLAKEFPDVQVYGTDTSDIAIKYAKENAELNRIKNVIFKKGPLFEPVKDLSFNLITSNPPYIKRKELKSLQPEIKDWEPGDALDGGEDGLNYYRLIIPTVKIYLKEGGYLMLELGVTQADAVKRMAEDTGLKDITLIKDYAGIDRILVTKI